MTPSTTSPMASPSGSGLSEARPVRGVDQDQQNSSGDGEDRDGGKKKGEGDALDAYCINLNKKAGEGKIDPLIGREQEVNRTIQILCRRQKNNPLFVGDPGVGKTAIAEGLARKIINGDVPEVLLELHGLPARHGRACLPARAIAAISRSGSRPWSRRSRARPGAIMFIDEIHTVIGAGRHVWRLHGCLEPAEAGAGQWRACAASARPPTRNTASTSRRTAPSCAASRRSTSTSRRSRMRSRS